MPVPHAAAFRALRLSCKKNFLRAAAVLAIGLLVTSACTAQAAVPLPKPYPLPARFKARVEMFRLHDEAVPSIRGGIVFTGSSLITGWNKNIERDFPYTNVIARGFGGSTILDHTGYAAITVLPHKPRQVVFYAGEEDIANGRSPEGVLEDFKKFHTALTTELPEVKLLYIGILPAPGRAAMQADFDKANALIRTYCERNPGLDYLDPEPAFLNRDGSVNTELFHKGGLTANEESYKILQPLIAARLLPEAFPFANNADKERAKAEKAKQEQSARRQRK